MTNLDENKIGNYLMEALTNIIYDNDNVCSPEEIMNYTNSELKDFLFIPYIEEKTKRKKDGNNENNFTMLDSHKFLLRIVQYSKKNRDKYDVIHSANLILKTLTLLVSDHGDIIAYVFENKKDIVFQSASNLELNIQDRFDQIWNKYLTCKENDADRYSQDISLVYKMIISSLDAKTIRDEALNMEKDYYDDDFSS